MLRTSDTTRNTPEIHQKTHNTHDYIKLFPQSILLYIFYFPIHLVHILTTLCVC